MVVSLVPDPIFKILRESEISNHLWGRFEFFDSFSLFCGTIGIVVNLLISFFASFVFNSNLFIEMPDFTVMANVPLHIVC